MIEYTLVVTSCERHDLLKRTLESFAEFADIEPTNTIIVEDSPLGKPEWLDYLKGLGNINWVSNYQRRGQTWSIDKAYGLVQTPFIFHCEDDWEFFRKGFIMESFRILDMCSEISMVGIRGSSEHPEEMHPMGFKIRQKDWNGWGGISWNPGLRRTSDYNRIGKFGNHVPYNLKCQEHGISLLYRKLGYYMASLPAACKHIGAEHKVWDKPVKNAKILVAFQVCHKYQVGNLAHENFDKHKNSFAFDQIKACRETWAKDVTAHGINYRFFYGNSSIQAAPTHPDETFLDVPDDYRNLPKKLKAICKWALDHGYEYIFKCDDDTYVWVDRLLDSDFIGHDCVGYDWGGFVGGFACWLSKKAMEAIVNAPDTTEPADDVWVGTVLKNAGISITHNARYHPNNENKFIKLENVPLAHSFIAIHACDADTIRSLYERKFMYSDDPISDKTGFATTAEKSFDDELNDIMGGLKL